MRSYPQWSTDHGGGQSVAAHGGYCKSPCDSRDSTLPLEPAKREAPLLKLGELSRLFPAAGTIPHLLPFAALRLEPCSCLGGGVANATALAVGIFILLLDILLHNYSGAPPHVTTK